MLRIIVKWLRRFFLRGSCSKGLLSLFGSLRIIYRSKGQAMDIFKAGLVSEILWSFLFMKVFYLFILEFAHSDFQWFVFVWCCCRVIFYLLGHLIYGFGVLTGDWILKDRGACGVFRQRPGIGELVPPMIRRGRSLWIGRAFLFFMVFIEPLRCIEVAATEVRLHGLSIVERICPLWPLFISNCP